MIRLCTCLELDADDCGECGPWTRAAPNGVGAAAVLVEPRGRSWEPLRGRATGFHLPSASVDASSGRRTRETMQNKGISETDHWNFRISREQQHWTQSLLTVRGPLQQDVAVQEAPMPFRESAGHGVPASSRGGAIGFSVTGHVHSLTHSRGRAGRGTNVKKQQQEGNQNVCSVAPLSGGRLGDVAHPFLADLRDRDDR